MYFSTAWWTVVKNDPHVVVHGQPLSDIVSVITVLGLFITLVMSLRALRESARANILTSLPLLTLKYKQAQTIRGSDKIVIENIGNGIALDVRVDNFYQSYIDDVTDRKRAQHNVLRFRPIDILKPSEEEELDTSASKVGGLVDAELMVFRVFSNEKPLKFHIRFQDIAGAHFISKIVISDNGVQVAGRPKRYSGLNRLSYFLYRVVGILRLVVTRVIANRRQKQENAKKT